MSLTDIATIVVSTTSAGVTRAGFGVPMIISFSASWVERVRSYSSLSAVGVDFAVNTPEYIAASKVFGQNPRPPSLRIGRAANKPTQRYTIGVPTGAANINQNYKLRTACPTGVVFPSQDSLYIGGGATVWSPSNVWSRGDLITNDSGKLYSCLGKSGVFGGYLPFTGFTGFGGQSGPTGTNAAIADNQIWWMYVGTGNTGAITNDAIMNGLQARFDYLQSPVISGTGSNQITSSLQGGVLSRQLRLTANNPATFFGLRVYDRNVLSVAQDHADPGIAADLAAIALESNDWYGLLTTFNSSVLVSAAAAWVEANTKLYDAASQDTDVPRIADATATDIAHVLKAAGYARSWIFWHPSNDEFAAAAEMGRFFPIDPGGETWRMKSLTGVTVEHYTDTEIANLKAKYAHFYYDGITGSNVIGGDAKVAANEYVDVVRFLDWYTSQLQGDLADLVIGADKIPFTNAGLDLIAGKVVKRNKAGIKAGGIADDPPPTVTVPDVSDISDTDKANREASGVQSQFELAGAIHHITVNVTATT
jgi:hypothetical protein